MIPVVYHETNIKMDMSKQQAGYTFVMFYSSRLKCYGLAKFSEHQLTFFCYLNSLSSYSKVVKEMNLC